MYQQFRDVIQLTYASRIQQFMPTIIMVYNVQFLSHLTLN